MGHKAVETTRNTNNASGWGTANKCAVQWWFKFCKGDKSLEDVEFSGLSSEVDDGQLRQSSKLILLQLHETLPKNSTWTILRSFGIWSKLERWKNLISECLICWLKIKHFKVSPFLIVRNNKAPFLDWTVMCDEKWILHDNQWQPAQWLDWKEAPKHFPKANFTKKWSCSLVDCFVWSTTTFWIPVKPLHLRSMLSTSVSFAATCINCSQHWSTERAQPFSVATPDHMSHDQCFKS